MARFDFFFENHKKEIGRWTTPDKCCKHVFWLVLPPQYLVPEWFLTPENKNREISWNNHLSLRFLDSQTEMYFLSGNIWLRENTGIPTALVNPLGFSSDDFDVVQAIYNQNNGTQAAGEVTAPTNEEPIVLGLRSGFQNVLDTIDITKSTSKNRQGKASAVRVCSVIC